jgi:hypothetical protein
MSDLHIDGTVFENLRHTFNTVTDRMNRARRTLRNADGTVVGSQTLINEVDAFADDWGYGAKQLGKHTQDAVKMLDNIGKSFSKYDHDLAESLDKAKKKKGK